MISGRCRPPACATSSRPRRPAPPPPRAPSGNRWLGWEHGATALDQRGGAGVSPRRGPDLERRAALAGEASADAAVAMEHVSDQAEPPAAPPDLTAAAFFDVD